MTRDEIEAILNEGTRFSRVRDPEDPRFEVITLRRPVAVLFGGADLPDVELAGVPARIRITKYVLATACGIAQGPGRDDVLAKRIEKLAVRLGVVR